MKSHPFHGYDPVDVTFIEIYFRQAHSLALTNQRLTCAERRVLPMQAA